MILIKQIAYLILLIAQASQDSYWHHGSFYLVRWHELLLPNEDINKPYLVFLRLVSVPKTHHFNLIF